MDRRQVAERRAVGIRPRGWRPHPARRHPVQLRAAVGIRGEAAITRGRADRDHGGRGDRVGELAGAVVTVGRDQHNAVAVREADRADHVGIPDAVTLISRLGLRLMTGRVEDGGRRPPRSGCPVIRRGGTRRRLDEQPRAGGTESRRAPVCGALRLSSGPALMQAAGSNDPALPREIQISGTRWIALNPRGRSPGRSTTRGSGRSGWP